MTERVQEETKFSVWYKIGRLLAWLIFHTVIPVTCHHKERADIDAPFILIANHQCWLDPVLMLSLVPRYEVRFLAKKELMDHSLLGGILRNIRAIGVDRHNFDMMAMRRCMQVIKDGHILGIFPEGTRYKKGVMEELEAGTAMIALRNKVPLLPVWIDGDYRPFRRMHVYVGEPIPMDDLRAQGVDKQICETTLARITQTYREMQTAKLIAPEGK
ncbi:MAG: 1-acyl-sn-glycerol-3-phosphate acyltransferase [Clostridia bacterium]|nr:1-acyl-sn-glycerol-3-phosphate acyltransferase [Clostridia bacterium]